MQTQYLAITPVYTHNDCHWFYVYAMHSEVLAKVCHDSCM